MSNASDFLRNWVRKNVTPSTAHVHNDTLTAGRLAEECLWEAQGENLSAAEVTEAAGGSLLTFYLRVSTDKQGRSGLGLEAQRTAVDGYLNGGRWTLVAEYVEAESGKRSDRPKLAKALAHAKAIGATVVFAKLDRLTRNVDLSRSLVTSDVGPRVLRLASRPARCNGPVPAHADGFCRRIRGGANQRAHQGRSCRCQGAWGQTWQSQWRTSTAR